MCIGFGRTVEKHKAVMLRTDVLYLFTETIFFIISYFDGLYIHLYPYLSFIYLSKYYNSISFFLIKGFTFQNNIKFTAKLRRRYRDFSYIPCPKHTQLPQLPTSTNKGGAFVTTDEFYTDTSLSKVHSLKLGFTLLYILCI